MTLADALKEPLARLVVLATLRAGWTPDPWARAGGYTNLWQADAPAAFEVEAVAEDGSTLTQAASAAAADLTPGSWYWDAAARVLYVYPLAGDPHAATVQARVVVRVANHPKRWGAESYESRLSEPVGVSLRVPEAFGGIGQVGGGRLVLEAGDGWADGLEALEWDAGTVTLELGADVLR